MASSVSFSVFGAKKSCNQIIWHKIASKIQMIPFFLKTAPLVPFYQYTPIGYNDDPKLGYLKPQFERTKNIVFLSIVSPSSNSGPQARQGKRGAIIVLAENLLEWKSFDISKKKPWCSVQKILQFQTYFPCSAEKLLSHLTTWEPFYLFGNHVSYSILEYPAC